jgi:outer membrane protein TolC
MRRAFATTLLVLSALPAGIAAGAAPATTAARSQAAAQASPAAQDGPLTLRDALAQALATSPRLEEARGAVARARGQKRGARAEGRPNVDLSASHRYQGPVESFRLPGGGSQSLSPSRQSEFAADVTIPIDANGQIRAGKRGAGHAVRAAQARLEAEAQRLVLDVTEAYLNLQQTHEELALVSELRKLNQERLRVARLRLAAGVGVPLEVSQPEADLAQAVQHEIEAQARVRQVGATLNSLIGRPANAEVEMAEVGKQSGSEDASSSPLPTAKDALANRPDLRALRSDVAQAQAGIDSARAARRPRLGLSGSLVESIPETLLGGFAWSLGASLIQSLFDGGRSRARVEQARADRMRAGAVLAEAERLADAQIEQSQAGLEAAEKRQAAEEQRVAAASDALTAARKRFEVGAAPQLQVTEAETTLTRAKTDALIAGFDAQRARVRLAYAVGTAYPETVLGKIQAVDSRQPDEPASRGPTSSSPAATRTASSARRSSQGH